MGHKAYRVLKADRGVGMRKMGDQSGVAISAGRQKGDRKQSLLAQGVDTGVGMAGRPVRRLVRAKDAPARIWAVRAVSMERPRWTWRC